MVRQLDETQLFLLFLARATLRGEVSRAEAEALNQIYVDTVVHRSGVTTFDSTDPAFRAVDRHAIGLMRIRLLELHPELEDGLNRFLGNGPGRV